MPVSIYLTALLPRVGGLMLSFLPGLIFLLFAFGARKKTRFAQSNNLAVASFFSLSLLFFALLEAIDALIFIFLPFYCAVLGGVVWGAGHMFIRFVLRERFVATSAVNRVVLAVVCLLGLITFGALLHKSYSESKASIAAARLNSILTRH